MGKLYPGRAILAFATALVVAGWGTALRAEPINFKELLPFVEVKLQGWEMKGKPSGQTITGGQMRMSQAKATYTSGKASLEISVMDGHPAQMAALGLGQNVTMESTEKYVRPVELDGAQGMETYHYQPQRGELILSVGGRFLVTLKGKGIENTDILKTAAQQLDLKKLAGLAK